MKHHRAPLAFTCLYRNEKLSEKREHNINLIVKEKLAVKEGHNASDVTETGLCPSSLLLHRTRLPNES